MPKVRVVHTTRYRYREPVRFTTHRLMLRPRDSHDLHLVDATLGLTPPVDSVRWAHDVFNNSVAYVSWPKATRSDHLEIVSRLDIEHFPGAARITRQTIDPAAASYPFAYSSEEVPDLAPLIVRHHPDPDDAVSAWARGFVPAGGGVGSLELLVAMTEAIRADFRYLGRPEEGTNPPAATLATRSGACRDFALLMMEAVRSLGFAAKFVSGYLYDEALADGRAGMVGGGATHAWCEVYLPGAGWVEFDPTNGLVAGRNLVRVCVARTPEQAVPISGGFIGERGAFVGLDVDVEVAVGEEPPPSLAMTPPLAERPSLAPEAEESTGAG